jgi:DNA-binding MarR family transcriptional regulator
VLIQLRMDRLESWSPLLGGILPMDLHILECVSDEPEIILKEVRERLEIPNSTLTSAVDRLERRNLLRRKISSRDRRSYGLELTEQGELLQQEHERVHRQVAATILNLLSPDEQQSLSHLLEKVLAGLQASLWK